MKKYKIDYRHIICIAITLGFLCCSAFIFRSAFMRFWDSLKSFGLSVAYYFTALFKIDNNIHITVNDMPKTNISFIPDNTTDFKTKLGLYWQALISKDNFSNYSNVFGSVVFSATQIILLVGVPLVLVFYILLRRYFKVENNDYNKDSKPLKVFKKIVSKTFIPIKIWLVDFIAFVKNHSLYIKLWLFIWLFNFNVIAIVLSFFAYYFYFVVSFDFASIYTQIYKLFADLSLAFNFIPWWIWVIIGLVLLDKWRKKIAYRRLNHMEMKNRGFINEKPLVFIICGTMGTGKTTTLTDIALSQEVMFRDKAIELMFKNDLKFPNFPWINLENEIKKHMEKHKIFNLATCRAFIEDKQKAFLKKKTTDYEIKKSMLFDYDYGRYGLTYDNAMNVINIWEVLKNYVQLYFIYIINSSLILSNYSIRTDNVLYDMGNFPMWDNNFLKRRSIDVEKYSRYTHIFNWDMFRMSQTIIENYSNTFEFGVVCLTELGKERGNMPENMELKKNDEYANQKNDGFEDYLMFIRHPAVVDNFPFVRFITDEQRANSWGAKGRQLCDLVYIREKSDTFLAMPFFFFGELIYDLVINKFKDNYYRYRFTRSDNTLFLYLFKKLTSKIYSYYTRIYNRFSYHVLSVDVANGLRDNIFKENKYYIMPKKAYSNRFDTACFKNIFTEKSLKSLCGINDLKEYKTGTANFDELLSQSSYMFNSRFGINKDEQKNIDDKKNKDKNSTEKILF